MKENDKPAQFPAPGEIRIIRTLPGPIERLWSYLTDPEKRSRWFAGGPMELRVGGKVELFFQHKNIAPGETPPEQYAKVHNEGFKMPGTILRCEPPRESSRREHERCGGSRFQRRLEGDVAREQRSERPRVEALAGRARVLGVLPHGLGAERDEPGERVVEALPDQPLQRLVAAGTLGAKVGPFPMAPDDAAREQHRAAGARPLVDETRPQAELARPRGAHEPGHAGARDEH